MNIRPQPDWTFLDKNGKTLAPARNWTLEVQQAHILVIMQKILKVSNKIPYILKSNPHSVFGDFLNEKKLVRGSNLHLSINHPLPTGRLIE